MSKYVDIQSCMQVIGDVFINPSLLDLEDKYKFNNEDFPQEFHKILFGSIYNLHQLGAKQISIEDIEKYLEQRPKKYAVYKINKGSEYLENIKEMCQLAAFDYYYNRLKKFSLLRAYDNFGIDITDIYDPDNILDLKKKQLQEDILDNSTLEQIAQLVDDKIEAIKIKYVDDCYEESEQAGSGVFDLIESFKFHPEVGVPLYGPFINTVTRGARLKKFYLRSAATGIGKTRTLVADACYIGCSKIYDEYLGWIKTGAAQPTLFITTEQDKEEVQTMMLAFLSNVNEDHIINGRYDGDEEDRVLEAARILSEGSLYIDELPDFSLQDVENRIKKNIREHDVKYVFFDYIMTSMKILEEITQRSGGVRLREDNILFMLSNRLKDLCNIYGIFIMSATQLNASYQDSETPDQNLLRGAKSIADKIDYGSLLLAAREKDIQSLEPILSKSTFPKPSIKMSIYKNRRGKYKGIYLWCKSDLGCCRVEPMFATDWSYELIQMDDIKIKLEEESAF